MVKIEHSPDLPAKVSSCLNPPPTISSVDLVYTELIGASAPGEEKNPKHFYFCRFK